MKIIALVSQKGGVGKTTIAIHLATAFQAAGYETLLIDLDPQASAAEWSDARADERPVVIAVPASRLERTLGVARDQGADVVIIDTAPHSEGATLEAAKRADLILVPCQPSIMDLRAMRKTADLLGHLKRPTYAILNGVGSSQSTVADEAGRAITEQFGMPVAPTRLGERVAYHRCLLTGQTATEYEAAGKAAQEVFLVHKWVCAAVELSDSGRGVAAA